MQLADVVRGRVQVGVSHTSRSREVQAGIPGGEKARGRVPARIVHALRDGGVEGTKAG